MLTMLASVPDYSGWAASFKDALGVNLNEILPAVIGLLVLIGGIHFVLTFVKRGAGIDGPPVAVDRREWEHYDAPADWKEWSAQSPDGETWLYSRDGSGAVSRKAVGEDYDFHNRHGDEGDVEYEDWLDFQFRNDYIEVHNRGRKRGILYRGEQYELKSDREVDDFLSDQYDAEKAERQMHKRMHGSFLPEY